MHLTSAEVGFAGAAITALAMVYVSRAGRRGEHKTRLRERRAGVYEDVLFYVARQAAQRACAMRALAGDEGALREARDLSAGAEETMRVLARLNLFGEPGARAAFGRWQEAELGFAAAFDCWRDCVRTNRAAKAGGAAPWEIGVDELKRRRQAVLDANDAAVGANNELVRVVREVRRLPRYGRWWLWRRR